MTSPARAQRADGLSGSATTLGPPSRPPSRSAEAGRTPRRNFRLPPALACERRTFLNRYRRAAMAHNRPPTTDQLRRAIDSGATGDKVHFPDPAAAPLGTDDEAGGRGVGALRAVGGRGRAPLRGPSHRLGDLAPVSPVDSPLGERSGSKL